MLSGLHWVLESPDNSLQSGIQSDPRETFKGSAIQWAWELNQRQVMNDINNTILPERALSGCWVAWACAPEHCKSLSKRFASLLPVLCCSCSSSNPLLPKAQLWGTNAFCFVIMRRLEQAVVSHPWCEDDMCSSAGSAYRFRHVRVMGDEMTHHWSLKPSSRRALRFPNVHVLCTELRVCCELLFLLAENFKADSIASVGSSVSTCFPWTKFCWVSASFLSPHAVFIICCCMKLMPLPVCQALTSKFRVFKNF